MAFSASATSLCFNPRLPCGRRPGDVDNGKILQIVSIHASHAGGDLRGDYADRLALGFNPRLPCGRRLLFSFSSSRLRGFQSTPPMREATQ